jgi:serine protease Do
MNGWRIAAGVAALSVAAGAGAALAPVVLAQGKTERPQVSRGIQIFTGGSRIGVSIRDVEQGDVKTEKGAVGGAVIEDVTSGSPAEKAGMRKGDTIVEFDGERVRSVRQLTRLVQETAPGRTVPAILLRDGQRTTVSVTPEDSGRLGFGDFHDLGDLARRFPFRAVPRPPVPPEPPTPPSPPDAPLWSFDEFMDRGAGRLGITVSSLSPQLAEYFGATSGVLVSSVSDGSAASKAGLKAGDVITSVNGAAVSAPADVRRRVQSFGEGDEFTIEVLRNKQRQTLKGKVEAGEGRRRSRVVL